MIRSACNDEFRQTGQRQDDGTWLIAIGDEVAARLSEAARPGETVDWTPSRGSSRQLSAASRLKLDRERPGVELGRSFVARRGQRRGRRDPATGVPLPSRPDRPAGRGRHLELAAGRLPRGPSIGGGGNRDSLYVVRMRVKRGGTRTTRGPSGHRPRHLRRHAVGRHHPDRRARLLPDRRMGQHGRDRRASAEDDRDPRSQP